MSTIIRLADVEKHTKNKSCWIIIHNDVYDVTKFLSEHPGGADSLLSVAGKNGTAAFEEVGHSDDAKEMMKQYKIGTLHPEDKYANVQTCCATSSSFKSLSSKPSSCSKKVSINDEHKAWHTFDDPNYSNWWKYALLALAGALIVGLIIKRQQLK